MKPGPVLVCTDFSAVSAAAEREAMRRFPGAALVVLHVVDPRCAQRTVDATGMDRGELLSEMTTYADLRLAEVVERMHSQGRQASAELARGDPVDTTLAVARRHRVETIVIGVEPGRAIGRFRTLLARRAMIPVLVVPSVV